MSSSSLIVVINAMRLRWSSRNPVPKASPALSLKERVA
jgi:hypothetical protein